MKRTLKTLALMLGGCALMLTAVQCNKSEEANKKAEPKTAQKKQVPSRPENELPNFRYVDGDSILSQYNLAKDYNEEMLRMKNNLETTASQRESALTSLLEQIQKKLQTNQYANEQQYNADQQKAAQMQSSAQAELAKMQNAIAQAEAEGMKTVLDSIHSYIEDYNAKCGYDAIFLKNATLYISPDLDITNEVLEGLNARYNKVKK